MKFEDILRCFGDLPWFDFEMVLLVSGEDDACVHTELYRWRRGGRLVELRRGLFVLAEPWRRLALEPASLAAPIYAPSYLTGRWVLERRGLLRPGVPEAAPLFTCATARPARVFENAFGTYRYETLPRDLLFGTEALDLGGSTGPGGAAEGRPAPGKAAPECRAALPEKALLDLCFFEGGDWDPERLGDLGLDPSGLDPDRLKDLAARSGRPRLIKAAKAYSRMVLS